MAVRWSRWSPQLALAPAVVVTLVVFIGGIAWTMYLSLTRSRRLPEYTINWDEWARNYDRIFKDEGWQISLNNLIVLGIGSALAIVFGFILAALIEREKRGEGIFRTVFLYPLAVSLIVTGVAWRWILNPGLGLEHFLHNLGLTWVDFTREDRQAYAWRALFNVLGVSRS